MSDEAPASLFTLDIERNGDTIAVRCHGKLVAGVSDTLYTRIKELIPGTKKIVMDMSDLTRLDSMGLGTLVRLYVSAKSAGCSLQLTHLSKQVRELLGLTDLLSVFVTIGERGIKMG